MRELRIWIAGAFVLLALAFGLKLLAYLVPSNEAFAFLVVPFVPPFLILIISYPVAALLRALYLAGKAAVRAIFLKRQ
jgi:hypothetical protein